MSRKTRVRFVVGVILSGSLLLAFIGIRWILRYPYFPHIGIVTLVLALVFILIIPATVRSAHKKADEAEMLAEWRARRDKQQPRR